MADEYPLKQNGDEVHRATKGELAGGIAGLFDAPDPANHAVDFLLKLGYAPHEIGILISEETKLRFFRPSLLTHPTDLDVEPPENQVQHDAAKPPESASVLGGAGAMSAVGALGGLLVAATAIVVAPPLGLLLLGPLAGLGAGLGALVGGMYAVPTVETVETELVSRYEGEVLAGKVLIHVAPRTPEHELLIHEEWDRLQAVTA